jgi:hypothetical protein
MIVFVDVAPEYAQYMKRNDTLPSVPPILSIATVWTMKDYGKDSTKIKDAVAVIKKCANARNILDTLYYGKTVK